MLTPKIPDRKADIQKVLDKRMVAVGPRETVRELRAKAKEYVKRYEANDSTLIKLSPRRNGNGILRTGSRVPGHYHKESCT